jgi:hypothetical protein
MNIRQVISNIKEGQEFKCDDGLFTIRCLNNGAIEIHSKDGRTFGFMKEDTFTKIKKAVNFEKAFKSLEEGKEIESAYNHNKYEKEGNRLYLKVEGIGYEECENISIDELFDDWYIEENEKEKELYPFQLCTDKWISKDGVHMEIKDMSALHIRNAFKMIEKICKAEKWNPKDYKIYNLLKEEYSKTHGRD